MMYCTVHCSCAKNEKEKEKENGGVCEAGIGGCQVFSMDGREVTLEVRTCVSGWRWMRSEVREAGVWRGACGHAGAERQRECVCERERVR